ALLFHVEQAPVQIAAPGLASGRNQGVAAGFEGDRRQRRAQVPQLLHRLAIQAPGPGLAAMPQSGAAGPSWFLPFGEDLQRLRASAHQAVAHAPAETTPVGEEVDSLEQAGL